MNDVTKEPITKGVPDDYFMTSSRGILIFGANGAGKTTLARELARTLGYRHIDVEDYYFPPSEIPYTVSRTKDEVIKLMAEDIEKYGGFVLSAVTGEFGDWIKSKIGLAVYLTAPLDVRIERIKYRAVTRFGKRVLPGGDMYESEARFIQFAANRSLDIIDTFAKTLTCPVLHLDGTKPLDKLLDEIGQFMACMC